MWKDFLIAFTQYTKMVIQNVKGMLGFLAKVNKDGTRKLLEQ